MPRRVTGRTRYSRIAERPFLRVTAPRVGGDSVLEARQAGVARPGLLSANPSRSEPAADFADNGLMRQSQYV